MSLRRLFHPESIALIGSSLREDTLSGRPLRILLQHGYAGRLYPVNPRYEELLGLRCYPAVAALPEPVDVALLLVNAQLVPRLVRECANAGVRFVVVVASGFAEQDAEGAAAQAELTALGAASTIRVSGPNAEGFVNLHGPVPLSFSPTVDLERGVDQVLAGDVAVVSQSGGVGFAIFNDGQTRGLGFSHVVSSGNEADLDALDYAEFLVDDDDTRVILLLVEGFKRPERFPAVAAAAHAAGKPLVVGKVGRSTAGARAALAHTAHEAGEDATYDEVFRQYGILRVEDAEEMVDVALALSRCGRLAGPRIGVLTLSGGAGAWLADALSAAKLELPELDAERQERIRPLIPPYGSTANPVDVTAQVLEWAGGVAPVAELMLDSPDFDAVVFITSLSNPTRMESEANLLRELADRNGKPLVVYTYTRPHPRSVEVLREAGLAWFTSTTRTARALRALADYGAATA